MKILSLYLISILLFGCVNSEQGKSMRDTELLIEPDTIYNEMLALKILEQNDTIKAVMVDTFCINQTKRAMEDIKQNKIYYFDSKGINEWKEMAELLLKYNIEYKNYEFSCFGGLSQFQHDCYQQLMWDQVDLIIGKEGLDSLWQLAEKSFVLKYPDSTYFKNGIDVRQKYLDEYKWGQYLIKVSRFEDGSVKLKPIPLK